MQVFDTKLKQWGNSLGITVPHDILNKENLSTQNEVTIFIVNKEKQKKTLNEIFGTLKCSKPTQKIMDEIDEGYD